MKISPYYLYIDMLKIDIDVSYSYVCRNVLDTISTTKENKTLKTPVS